MNGSKSNAALTKPPPAGTGLVIGGKTVPLVFRRNLRARKYILRVRPDGSARVTIPRGGTEAYAVEFALKHQSWLRSQLEKHAKNHPIHWKIGTSVFFRGEAVAIQDYIPDAAGSAPVKIWKVKNCKADPDTIRAIRFSNHVLRLPKSVQNFKPHVQFLMKRLAAKEIPERTFELARQYLIPILNVFVRNQRSRWGSCSSKGNISLNWRLIQIPEHVRDYMIFHELAHVRHMNHSAHFWREVERMCPEYLAAEQWLKENQRQLFNS